jgi:hypothetical protein
MISLAATVPAAPGRWVLPVTGAKRRRVGGAISLAFLTAWLVSGCGRPALHCGNTVTMRDHDTLLAALVERGTGLFAGRLHGVEVSFHAEGKELGRARTDKSGYAVTVGRLPVGTRSLEARCTLDGHTLTSQGKVLSWEPGRTIVICDIDGTISDTDYDDLFFKHWDTESKPLPGAPQTLQRLSKGYNLLFLTGRPVAWYAKTHKWLDDHGFPAAPVVLAPTLRSAVHVKRYKAEAIARVKRLYPDALIGIGNAQTDSEVYTAEGVLAIMIDDGKERRFRSEAIALRTWRRVREFFDANHDILSDPSQTRTLLSEGGFLLYPQPPIHASPQDR